MQANLLLLIDNLQIIKEYFSGTHCLAPPTPQEDLQLEPVGWDGEVIDVGEKIQYQCKNGMKFEQDFDMIVQEATCKSGYEFDEPEWSKCVESKHMSSLLNDH